MPDIEIYARRAFKICSTKRDSFEQLCLVVLDVPASARVIETEWNSDGVVTAFRCEWAFVRTMLSLGPLSSSPPVLDLSVKPTVAYSCFYRSPGAVYKVGRRVWARNFDPRGYITAGGGIHCYVDQFTALNSVAGGIL